MSCDRLHDALNELDDALIEEVEALRGKPRSVRRRWVRPVAVAACFCVMAMTLLAIQAYDLWKTPDTSTQGGDDAAGTVDGSTGEETHVTEIQPEVTVTEPYLDGSTTIPVVGNATQPTKTGTGALTQIVEKPAVKMRIVNWDENGFVGVITEHVDTDVFAIGSKVTVRFLEHTGFEVTEGEFVSYHTRVPTEDELPIDSEVTVQIKETSVPDQGESDELIVYAGMISVEQLGAE